MLKKKYSNYKKKVKDYFKTIIKTKTSPHSIALGFAIGTLINILPTPGLNIILGLLSLLVFKKASKFSLLISMLVWNPITTPFIYILSFKIGEFFFPTSSLVVVDITLWQQVFYYSRKFLVGNLILAVSLSITSYFLIKSYMKKHYAQKKKHHV